MHLQIVAAAGRERLLQGFPHRKGHLTQVAVTSEI
jgi:hypothetical protein